MNTGIEKSIEAVTRNCKHYIENSKSQQREPLILAPIPDYPMQYVVSDLFEYNGYMYLIYACRLTGWVELGHFQVSTKSTEIINTIRNFFHIWGVPQEISVDGASNLLSQEFQKFLSCWSVQHRISSAYYPQCNGRAEAAVKSMKRLIRGHTGKRGSLNTDAIAQGLLQYRNTPLHNAAGQSSSRLALDVDYGTCFHCHNINMQ